MKKVDAKKSPGLAKLPKVVRNKMGYAKNGTMAKNGLCCSSKKTK